MRMRGSCMHVGQNDAPVRIVNMTSASFDNAFRQRCVIRRGTANTWGIWGRARRSSLNISTTVSMAAGGGIQRRAAEISCSRNQS